MDEREFLAERFDEHRAHLTAVAGRMLGSPAEADDAVREARLRLTRSETGAADHLGGWLTTVVGRVCLDMLRSRRSGRPAPPREVGDEPRHEVLIADSVGLALLVVLESLRPSDRLAFVLHDLFGMPFEEIGPMLDSTPAAARELAGRARRRVQGADPG
ncbi:sigma-70 family RNA polymerase sigma factor [Actinomadura soli]|uniref:Sigma-70 family RNA polymerase sigma factor n=1 Tax=Actinomadura soli TaxID=2508997 RepID=A0A5C4J8P4_9ACTN|nr:sigma-70 family RNA polymerase sigma factor [Actinomadura soli]TMQ92943.1 sigma-70 family RNA polymerase sigma factor [Actinomadura soli]